MNCKKEKSESKNRKETLSFCEYLKQAIDLSLINSVKHENTFLIFVFRPGQREKNQCLIEKRINSIKKYLKLAGVKLDIIVITKGKKTNNLGKIEIYVAGKLEWEIFLEEKKEIFLAC